MNEGGCRKEHRGQVVARLQYHIEGVIMDGNHIMIKLLQITKV